MKHKRNMPGTENISIRDVAGIKLILEDPMIEAIEDIIHRIENCEIREIQNHKGQYNAKNIIVGYRPMDNQTITHPLIKKYVNDFFKHGATHEQVVQAYEDFVTQGEENIELEIIISNYEELIESEMGRCMHEERIIKQRRHQQYQGQLAQNIEFLIEFIFTLPFSSQPVEELPIKLWNLYLPDYFHEVRMNLLKAPAS